MNLRALSIYMTLLTTVLATTVAAQKAAPDDRETLNPMHAIAKESLKAFVDAPLFEPTRQRAVDAPAVANVAPSLVEEPPPSLHLLGVIHGDRDMAMVRRNNDAKVTMLATGDHIGSWLVTILATTGIRLSDRTRAFDYVIFTNGGGNSGPIGVESPNESAKRGEPSPPGHAE